MIPPDRISRRSMLAGLLAATATGACANAPERSIRPAPRGPGATSAAGDALVAEARLDGRTAYAVADARTGRVLEASGGGVRMPPASVAKAATALYALERLGPDHRFVTRLVATGPVRGGRLEGDLVLAGGGDPHLATDDLAAMAAALKAAGVVEVSGRFLTWEGALPFVRAIDRSQPDHVGYNPAVSGLNLNYNRVHFEWRRGQGGWDVAMDARSERYRPDVRGARMRVADRQAPLFTYADGPEAEDWTVASAGLGASGSRWLPVRRPGRYAAEVLAWFARAQGIALPPPATAGVLPQGTVLAEHVSVPMTRVVADMLRYSTNITAEAVGMAATLRGGAVPGGLADSAGAMSRWIEARSGAQGVDLVDHSGLGEDSRIAPADMTRLLVAAGPDGPLRPLLRRYEIEDRQGRPLRGVEVAAKTGTLNFVSGLAGYVQTPSGRVLAFAVFSGDLDRRARLSGEARERPPGGRDWAGRARVLQHRLIGRWVAAYG